MWYQIQTVLGRGGFGITYLAHDSNLDHKVAIKEYLPKDWATRQEDSAVRLISVHHEETFDWGLKSFISEAQTLAKFRHPNIVRVLSVFRELNTAYMVMEYEQGEELSVQIKRGETFTEKRLLDIVVPLLEGLDVVHQEGFIHRDIKPSNIMIRADGSPVLIDFGSARQAIGVHTQTLTSMLTFGYAPFEQYNQGSGKQGPWTDIYALAATLYYAVTGQIPVESMKRAAAIFNAEEDCLVPASKIAAGNYTDGFLHAIDAGLGFAIQDRPQSLGEWRKMLLSRRFVNGTSTSVSALQGRDETTVGITAERTQQIFVQSQHRNPVGNPARNAKTQNITSDSAPIEGSESRTESKSKKTVSKLLYAVMMGVVSLVVASWYVAGARDPVTLVEQYLDDAKDAEKPELIASPSEDGISTEAQTGAGSESKNKTLPSVEGRGADNKLAEPGLAGSKSEPDSDVKMSQKNNATTAQDYPATASNSTESGGPEPGPLSKKKLLSGIGIMQITSDPAGAAVSLDGIKIGSTPFYSQNILEGDYTLALNARNFRSHSQKISVEAGAAVNELIKLKPTQVDLTIESEPEGAWVEINSELLAELTPVTLTGIKPGIHQIRVGKSEYETFSENVDTARDVKIKRNISLIPIEYGQLTISPNPPSALINLPDVEEPYRAGMKLPVGEYRLEVVANNYEPWLETLTLTTGGLVKQVDLNFILKPGDSFSDELKIGGQGPELVILPEGSFVMGSSTGARSEYPERKVSVAGPIAAMKHELTIGDFQKFIESTSYQADSLKQGNNSDCRGKNAANQGGSENHAVSCVSWHDAKAYAEWLSGQTGVIYRLPSEAEWEYAARAGAASDYAWGEYEPVCATSARNGANFLAEGCAGRPDIVGNYSPNKFGLFDMHGNLWEWVEDCWHPNYVNAPTNSGVWQGGDCRSRVLRGGSWANSASYLRVSFRGVAPQDDRDISYGFRLVRELGL